MPVVPDPAKGSRTVPPGGVINRISHAILNEVNFENASLQDCEFHGIEAIGLNLCGADLRGSQLSGLDIRKIDMRGVIINGFQQTALLEAIGMIVED